MDHSLHLVVKEVLSAAGFSLDDVVSWGGQIRYDAGLPKSPNRLGAVQRGEVDMIIDEAVRSWVDTALESDMRIMPFDEPLLERLEELGFRRAVISKASYTKLKEDVPTLDFSGFPVYTHINVPDNDRYFNLFGPRSKEGKNPVARRRSPTLGPHVS